MMRKLWTLSLWLVATPMSAQQGPPPRVQMLQEQVMQRFLTAYRNQAGLTPEQDRRFTEVFSRSLEQRREIRQREQQLWRALERQMRPGVAAHPDSVTRLVDGIVAQRGAMVDQARNEQREYAQFLTPVQLGQLVLMMERFQQQVEGIVQRRMQMQGGRPGRMPPDTMSWLEPPPM
ncbi:MAG TPA: hypothetical protein VJL31_08450 [Gemmatimonadales bacterium]|jgi:hypothetical protein|nr:hypothetical protein [Gemmatimonadales bacterium]